MKRQAYLDRLAEAVQLPWRFVDCANAQRVWPGGLRGGQCFRLGPIAQRCFFAHAAAVSPVGNPARWSLPSLGYGATQRVAELLEAFGRQ